MNELDLWTRMREHEREARHVEASAWKLPAKAGRQARPRTGRGPWASGLRRTVGGWLMSLGEWIAGAPAASSSGGQPHAAATPGGRPGSA